jgi:hypothetical protein
MMQPYSGSNGALQAVILCGKTYSLPINENAGQSDDFSNAFNLMRSMFADSGIWWPFSSSSYGMAD